VKKKGGYSLFKVIIKKIEGWHIYFQKSSARDITIYHNQH